MSSTAIVLPVLSCNGSTISEFEAESQAICPANSCTSFTSWILSVATAVPHTPLPTGIVTQAGLP